MSTATATLGVATTMAVASMIGCAHAGATTDASTRRPLVEAGHTPPDVKVSQAASSSMPSNAVFQSPPAAESDKSLPTDADRYVPVVASLLAEGKLRDALAVLDHARRECGPSAVTLALSIDTRIRLRLWQEAGSDLALLHATRPAHAARLEADYHLSEYQKLTTARTPQALELYLATVPPQPWRDYAEEKHDELLLAAAGDGVELESIGPRLLSQRVKEQATARVAAWRNRTWQNLVQSKISCQYSYRTYTYNARVQTTVYGSTSVTRFVPETSESSCEENTVTVSLRNLYRYAVRVQYWVGAGRTSGVELAPGGSRTLTVQGDCSKRCEEFSVTVVGGEEMP